MMTPKPGKRIRACRIALNLTQKQVCDKADISASFYSEVENDKRNVSALNLYHIARCLGVTMDYLMTGEQVEDE